MESNQLLLCLVDVVEKELGIFFYFSGGGEYIIKNNIYQVIKRSCSAGQR
jgi:hypothetical protein